MGDGLQLSLLVAVGTFADWGRLGALEDSAGAGGIAAITAAVCVCCVCGLDMRVAIKHLVTGNWGNIVALIQGCLYYAL